MAKGAFSNAKLLKLPVKKRWSTDSEAAEVRLGRLSRPLLLLPPLKQLGDKIPR